MNTQCKQNLSVLIIYADSSKLRLWLICKLIIQDRFSLFKNSFKNNVFLLSSGTVNILVIAEMVIGRELGEV